MAKIVAKEVRYLLTVSWVRGDGSYVSTTDAETGEALTKRQRISRIYIFTPDLQLHKGFVPIAFDGVEVEVTDKTPLRSRRKAAPASDDAAYVVIEGSERILCVRADILKYEYIRTVAERLESKGYFRVVDYWASQYCSPAYSGSLNNPHAQVRFDNYQQILALRAKIEELYARIAAHNSETHDANMFCMETYLPLEQKLREALGEYERINAFYSTYTLDDYNQDMAAGREPGCYPPK